MTTATLTKYASRIENTFNMLSEIHEDGGRGRGAQAHVWWNALNDAMDQTPMSLKSWISNHDMLETLQVSFNDDDEVIRIWSPGIRELTVHATYVSLAGSRRNFAGVVHIVHDSNTWVGFDVSANTLIAYRTL